MTESGDEVPTRDWMRGVAIVVVLVGLAILFVAAAVNAQCNCLTPA